MGLTDNGISRTRSELERMQKSKNDLLYALRALEVQIQKDENFQKFKDGTDIGKRCDDKIRRIIEIANKACDSTGGVVNTTNRFLDQQAQANREKAKLNQEAPVPAGSGS
jgi:hypothetical protein